MGYTTIILLLLLQQRFGLDNTKVVISINLYDFHIHLPLFVHNFMYFYQHLHAKYIYLLYDTLYCKIAENFTDLFEHQPLSKLAKTDKLLQNKSSWVREDSPESADSFGIKFDGISLLLPKVFFLFP